MKIALLTYFSVNNTGQFFQALATVDAISTCYPDAHLELVNIHHERRPTWLPPKSLPDVIPSLIRHSAYAKARKKQFSKVLGKQRFDRPSGQDLEKYLNEHNFDVVITGADTCLKIDKHWEGKLPPYWIPPGVNSRKYFLAGSAENTLVGDLSNDQMQTAKAALHGMSGIYVRDTMTRNLCSELAPDFAQKIQIVADPTYTLKLSEVPLLTLRKRFGSLGKPLCAVNLPKSAASSAIIQQLSNEYTVFALNRASQTGEASLFLGPWDWLAMWNSIDAIVTTSFHETIFAMRSGVPFISLDVNADRASRDGARSKAADLLTLAGFENFLWNMPSAERASQILAALESSKSVVNTVDILKYNASQADSYLNALKSIGS